MISIKSMRQAAGIPQWKLAEELKVSQESVAQWETGKTSPRFDRLVKIAEALNCKVDDLVRADD